MCIWNLQKVEVQLGPVFVFNWLKCNMSYIVTTAHPWKACLEVQWGTDVGMWEYTKYIRVVKIEQIRGAQI